MFMTKKLILPFVVVLALSGLPACNSSDNDTEYVQSSSVLVSAFSLTDDDDVLDSLQNVYFSIDLENAQIFNADSLPYGTNTSRLIPSITCESTVSAVTLTFPLEDGTDSVVNYLTNSTDSIDFSLGPVKLKVTSQSGTVERTYQVKVNVHQTKPDTLAWNQIESCVLPTNFSGNLDAQRTVKLGDTYYCLTYCKPVYCLAKTDNPADPNWSMAEISMPFDANVSTLRQSDDALYMLSTDGTLYTSQDCENWTATDAVWDYIYGGYGQQILGCSQQSGSWMICSYPDMQQWSMPDGFPVRGSSVPCVYQLQMGVAPQLVMVGGWDANGSLLATSWAFDGEGWADISRAALPEPTAEIAVVDYDLFSVSSSTWAPVQYPALVAIGGLNADGINRTVYYSRDWGMTWDVAPDLMQLSDEVPVYYGSSAFVFSTTMYLSRSNGGWTQLAVRKLYPHCTMLWPEQGQSRVTTAITEWECPAIYMFGGYDANGSCVNQVWRGVILRYTFDPVY